MARLNVGRPESVVREQIEIAVAANGLDYVNELNSEIQRLAAKMDILNIDLEFGDIKGREYNDTMRHLVATQRDLAETARMATEYINTGSMALGTAQSRAAALARGFLEVSRGVEDFATAGPIGALNNIPTLMDNVARYVGLTSAKVAALTAATGVAATSVYVLWRNWDTIAKLWKDDGIRTASERMEELGKKTSKTAEEQAELNRLKREQHDIEALARIKTIGQKAQEDMVRKAFEETVGPSENTGAWYLKGMYGGDIKRTYTDAEKERIDYATSHGYGANVIAKIRAEVDKAAQLRLNNSDKDNPGEIQRAAASAMRSPEQLRAYVALMEKGGASPEFLDKLRAALPENIEKLRKFRDEAKAITESFADLRRAVDMIDWSKPEEGMKKFVEITRPTQERVAAFRKDIAGLKDKDTHDQLFGVTKTFEDMVEHGVKKFVEGTKKGEEKAQKDASRAEGRDIDKVAGRYAGAMRGDAEKDVALGLSTGADAATIRALIAGKARESMLQDEAVAPEIRDAAAEKAAADLLARALPQFTVKGKSTKEAADAWLHTRQFKADDADRRRFDAARREAERLEKERARPFDEAAKQWDGGANDYLEGLFLANRMRQEEAHARMAAGMLNRPGLAREQAQADAAQARDFAALKKSVGRLPRQQQQEAMNAFWNSRGPGAIRSDDEMKAWLEQRAAAQMLSAGQKHPTEDRALTADEAKMVASRVVARAIKEAQARQNQANTRTLTAMDAITAAMTEVVGANLRYAQGLDRVRAQASGIRTAASSHRR